MLTVAPGATAGFTPLRERVASSATNTLNKRGSSPWSSKSRSAKPGCAASRALSTSATVAPSADSSAAPPESSRRCVGMRTGTDMCELLLHGFGRERVVERVEGGWDDRGRTHGRDHRVEGLEAVAGD